jgi:protein-S-isoprenylcysteine O-methyltransferase Ste14
MKDSTPTTPGRLLMAATRIWLPVAIAVAGVVLIVLGHASLSTSAGSHPLEAGAGVALLIVALIVWMVNWMFRMSVESNVEREREEMAREYFDRHGHWPDEDG